MAKRARAAAMESGRPTAVAFLFDLRSRRYTLQVLELAQPNGDGSIAIEARLSPLSYPVPIRNRVPFGSGSNDWIVVPRLEATGEVRIDGEAIALEAVPAYHDHNRGRWYWGDELGWEWGYAREPARREGFTVVFERVTDRFHEPIGEGALLVWEGERMPACWRKRWRAC